MFLVRSLAFNAAFYLNLIVQMIIFLPMFFVPRRRGMWIVAGWAKSSIWLHRVLVGARVKAVGLENIPAGSAIIASKHQSFWECFALIPLLHDPAFILKRELSWIPFFGWYTLKYKMIRIRRGSGGRGVRSLIEEVRKAVAQTDRHIIIFPEGTRKPPGAPTDYRAGVSALYAETGLPCVPVALNSGLFWPRRKFLRYPGTITIEFLPVIEAGLTAEEFRDVLEDRIETATDRLLRNAGKRRINLL